MRSYSGCLTCRQRKLKCDESKPLCDNCRRSSRECVFLDRSIFRGFESQPSSGCKGLFADSQVWLEVPPRLTFIHVHDSYEVESPPPLLHQQSETEISPPASAGVLASLISSTAQANGWMSLILEPTSLTKPLSWRQQGHS
ncbi:fungal zn(2)-Cys(6) binuclear cluster domain-containing protein [Hirsutella rhossiliensis]|uniref:Fungal zn(2)-Cys(6) binuclear cluster domain-containing protein n=1 Tax=Hirsutella rhossiliensis TaxID=111463 RepID=A0A9P8MWW8_9HYPO|nr:fungal zn(2)-Cys(6) binuclear cluster domain-containing protein [Hirsutella rhossiliensis]KAH0963788.1 fungal zn(2)-Cys(6) binuclear cluster domain-containing protein [Hirsutella rhossiliensis]